jgi:IMP dehydrogenase/GMP reductase
MKFDFNDILITPAVISSISSRSEVDVFYDNKKLPLITAPMIDVVGTDSLGHYLKNGINICLPRTEETTSMVDGLFCSYSLNDFELKFLRTDSLENRLLNSGCDISVCIDIANGHMQKLVDIIKEAKDKYGDNLQLMVGNIANPLTYQFLSEAGADYIRCGIGGGSACLTSVNTSIGYPMGSLIREVFDISLTVKGKPAKIVADGGFKNYGDIIKALALGADYVMLGSIFAKCYESSGEYYNDSGVLLHKFKDIENQFNSGWKLFKKYRGMSSKEVQKLLNSEVIKTSEGTSKSIEVTDSLYKWTENFIHYLKSAMSYTDNKDLRSFIGGCEYTLITENAHKRFDK